MTLGGGASLKFLSVNYSRSHLWKEETAFEEQSVNSKFCSRLEKLFSETFNLLQLVCDEGAMYPQKVFLDDVVSRAHLRLWKLRLFRSNTSRNGFSNRTRAGRSA